MANMNSTNYQKQIQNYFTRSSFKSLYLYNLLYLYFYIKGETNLICQLIGQQYFYSDKSKLIPKCCSDSKSINADQRTALILSLLLPLFTEDISQNTQKKNTTVTVIPQLKCIMYLYSKLNTEMNSINESILQDILPTSSHCIFSLSFKRDIFQKIITHVYITEK